MSQLDDPRRMTRPVLESTSFRELRNRAGVRGIDVEGKTRTELIEAILTVESGSPTVDPRGKPANPGDGMKR